VGRKRRPICVGNYASDDVCLGSGGTAGNSVEVRCTVSSNLIETSRYDTFPNILL
jgi:hypothetical protein